MRIERDIINQFIAWKEAAVRKPILLKGARQIGMRFSMLNLQSCKPRDCSNDTN